MLVIKIRRNTLTTSESSWCLKFVTFVATCASPDAAGEGLLRSIRRKCYWYVLKIHKHQISCRVAHLVIWCLAWANLLLLVWRNLKLFLRWNRLLVRTWRNLQVLKVVKMQNRLILKLMIRLKVQFHRNFKVRLWVLWCNRPLKWCKNKISFKKPSTDLSETTWPRSKNL